jgi:hypothetical protein
VEDHKTRLLYGLSEYLTLNLDVMVAVSDMLTTFTPCKSTDADRRGISTCSRSVSSSEPDTLGCLVVYPSCAHNELTEETALSSTVSITPVGVGCVDISFESTPDMHLTAPTSQHEPNRR